MIRQCAKCLLILGEKAPFSDMSVSHTYCDTCFKKEMALIEEWKQKQAVKKVA